MFTCAAKQRIVQMFPLRAHTEPTGSDCRKEFKSVERNKTLRAELDR